MLFIEKYSSDCPLGKFKVLVKSEYEYYTADPVEACISCKFADTSQDFDLEKICQHPEYGQ